MKRLAILLPLVLAFGVGSAGATTIVGDLNNFDTVNDTGQVCYGFEIEIDGIHSTDITYTFDWNHYGVPKIREDNTDPAMPKVFVRYESTKDSSGAWGANGSFTNTAIATLTPPAGHTCTDTSVNEGCEHFGVGYYGTPAGIKYNWLVDGGAGNLVYSGSPVAIGTPAFTYTPPAANVPAQAVAVIPAPVVPIAAGKQFGEPSWVKVIKTTTHNANRVALQDLVSDTDGAGVPRWRNGEPAEVESEWYLLQTNTAANGAAKAELQGLPDDMGDGSETVTRRYEFYRYGAAADTLDGENGEAMCSEVDPTTDPNDPAYLHGIGDSVAVTDANGDTYYVNCAAQIVVGNFIGAQMAGFAAVAPLGLIDHLQDGESGTPYTPRTVVVGGNAPFAITITGSLPPGLSLDSADGVLSGTPSGGGDFAFTVQAVDADNNTASQTYSLHVIGQAAPQFHVDVATQGSGQGAVTGNGINCSSSCSVLLDADTSMSLTATPASGSVFRGWSGGSCAGMGDCTFTLKGDATVHAEFVQQWTLTVSKAGAGTGTVTGNGISCGATCSVQLDQDTPVLLTATATNGSVFTGWSSNCTVTPTGDCSTTLGAATTVTATFVPPTQPYTLSVTLSLPDGTVTSSPKGISCGKRCSATFTVGTSVTLTAKPDKKHRFLGWTGACAGSGTPTCVVPMLSDRSVGANFD